MGGVIESKLNRLAESKLGSDGWCRKQSLETYQTNRCAVEIITCMQLQVAEICGANISKYGVCENVKNSSERPVKGRSNQSSYGLKVKNLCPWKTDGVRSYGVAPHGSDLSPI